MTKIQFDYFAVTISDGFVLAHRQFSPGSSTRSPPRLPGYGSLPFELDADYNIARGLIERIGVGNIVHLDKMPPSFSPD